MTIVPTETRHASCVSIKGRAVLIEGPSGAGKSDLALRLIDRGAMLVSDDYTVAENVGKTLMASTPVTIAGHIEVRGLGILPTAHVDRVPVALLVDLAGVVDRMPDAGRVRAVAGIDIPLVTLAAYEASAPIKVEMALAEFGLVIE